MRKIAVIAGCLVTTFAHAQSTGIPWQNGRILTAPMLQSLDQAKMNISSLGKPGFAPQLNALGQITSPVVGDVSQAKATADGQTVVEVTAKAANAVQKTDIGATVAPLDTNKMMSAPVSGDSSAAPVVATGTTQSRNLATREADTRNLSNYVSAYDGSDTFKSQVMALYNSLGQNAIIPLPCGAAWPMYDTTTGLAWGPSGKGALFVDTCGNNWRGAPSWATPAYDRGMGDNNNVIANYNGMLMVNRVNTSSSNGNGQLSLHVRDYSTSATSYGSAIFADAPLFRPVYDMMQYGVDGKTPTQGSPVVIHATVNNWTGTPWSVQAQGIKATCNIMVANGSCWAGSTEANNKSGHTGTSFNLLFENDQEGNGPEVPAATYDPKQSHNIMSYASAIALSPPSWTASTTYNVLTGGEPTKIDVFDSTGAERILIVKTAGVSGTTAPVVDMTKLKEYDTITDGTVVWEVGTTRENVTGVVYWINHDPAKAGGNASDMNSYNFGVSTNARFNNSVFDTSHATMNNARAAAYRMGDNQRFSLCDPSTAAADTDLNKCTLTHSSAGRLIYNVGGAAKVFFGDDGTVWSATQVSTGNVNATYDVTAGGNVKVGASLYLGSHPKAYILAIASPVEGMKFYDSDDHAEVTYRCPTTSTCGWFPVQYGTALSN